MSSSSRQGLSLVETLIALFLLSGAALACLSLLLQANRNQRLTMETLEASRFAELCQARVRSWASDPANFLSNWAIYSDLTVTDASFPGMSARVQAAPAAFGLVTPNTSLEAPFAPGMRTIQGGARQLKVSVQWFSHRERSLVVRTLIGAPSREVRAIQPIRITQVAGASSPMAVNATATFQAELLDSGDEPIQGVRYNWTVEPYSLGGSPGKASLELLDRMGLQAMLIHRFYEGDPYMATAPGDVQMVAYCRYAGRDWIYRSDPITLAP